jgi:predicted RNA-binding protein with PIN domain
MGHYEPLRHYAEVHLILEPLPRGSGLVFDTAVSEDDLALNWQRLILTHLEEKEHIGTLTGSPITDMKITICAGKAHLKHTEGGDFRQATYRAVRHGLRNVENILLEPFYDYELEIPMENTGRALADLQRMSADFSSPETAGEMAVIRGSAPVAEMNDYISEVVGYTRGKGRLTCINGGYRECHNAEEIIEKIGYNCDSDVENTADSVFCSHGAGMNIKWDEAAEYMHLPSMIQRAAEETENPVKVRRHSTSKAASEEELMEIFEMTYGKIDKEPRNVFKSAKVKKDYSKSVKLPNYEGPDYLLVDGYNIIFAWDELKKISETNLDAARAELIKILSNYQGWCGYEIIIVFDAYKVKGKHREVERHFNVNVVYTKESETADSYIERVTHELLGKHRVRVATSDGVEQLIILGSGAMRMTARELKKRIEDANSEIRDIIKR